MTKGQDPEDQLVMPEGGPFEAGGRYQALCLSGGGYRGLYTAILLEELERRAGKQLRECFDLIAGTSIGGILAIIAAVFRKTRQRNLSQDQSDIGSKDSAPVATGFSPPIFE